MATAELPARLSMFVTSKFFTPKLAPPSANARRSKPLPSQSGVGARRSRSRQAQASTAVKTTVKATGKTTANRTIAQPLPLRSIPLQARNRATRLQPLPNQLPVPQWLQLLKQAERVSLILAGVLAGGAIVTYGWAMYSQQQWGNEYRRLDQLRRNERQLTTNGELMKNNIARTSDPKHYGLVPRGADHIVVIPPSSPRAPLPMRAPGPDPHAKPITPVGY
jgi:hypothetical protein